MSIFVDKSLLTKTAKALESQLKQRDFETTGEYGSLVHMDLRQTSKTTNEDQ